MSCSNDDIIQTSLLEGWKVVGMSTTAISSNIPVFITVTNTDPLNVRIIAKDVPVIFDLDVENKENVFNEIFAVTGPLDMSNILITISDEI